MDQNAHVRMKKKHLTGAFFYSLDTGTTNGESQLVVVSLPRP